LALHTTQAPAITVLKPVIAVQKVSLTAPVQDNFLTPTLNGAGTVTESNGSSEVLFMQSLHPTVLMTCQFILKICKQAVMTVSVPSLLLKISKYFTLISSLESF